MTSRRRSTATTSCCALRCAARYAALGAGGDLPLGTADDPRSNGDTRAAAIIYGVCVVAMLTVSGIYHMPRLFGRDRRILRRLDHATILVCIAGTYTGVIVLGMSGATQAVLPFSSG